MKKILILSSMVSLLILGCGSGEDSNSSDKKSIDNALKIGDVAYSTPAGIDFGNKMRTNLNKTYRAYKSSFLNLKTNTEACSNSGTVSYEESNKKNTITFNECINLNENTNLYEYYNGIMSVTTEGDNIAIKNYWYIPDIEYLNTGTFMNLTMNSHQNGDILEIQIDGKMVEFANNNIIEDASFDRVVMKENSSNNALYLDGSYTYNAGCIDESYTFKTSEWLIPNSNNEDEYTHGTITVNGMTYTYIGDKVSVKKGDKVGEFSQSELNREIENKKSSTECGVKKIYRE
jgi:predicted ester cyclase